MPEEWGKHLEMQFTLARGRGFLQVQEEGGKIRLYGELPEDGRGIYKGRIQGPGGGAYLAGTFLPEGEKLCLRRVMSREMLKDLGVWPVTGGSLSRPGGHAFWTCPPVWGIPSFAGRRRAWRGRSFALREKALKSLCHSRWEDGSH